MAITLDEKTLVADGVQIDIGILKAAQSPKEHPSARQRAQQAIVDAFVKALKPEDKERFEAYEGGKH